MFEERRLETARELLARGCAELVRRDTPLEPALQLIEAALLISPMLRSCAWERGFALYYKGAYAAAADQFSACCQVDPDDLEPFLWRCLAASKGKGGWEGAREGLREDFKGYDRRVAMMMVLSLFLEEEEEGGEEGRVSVQMVLECAGCDCHASQRAAFACALYFEARGEEEEALRLLQQVTAREEDGDVYMRELAHCHWRVLSKRIRAKGVPRVKVGGWEGAFETPRVIMGGWQLSEGHAIKRHRRRGKERDEEGAIRRSTGREEQEEEEEEEEKRDRESRIFRQMQAHLEAGITAFDCGDIYTGVESVFGRFLLSFPPSLPSYALPFPLQIHTKLVPDLAQLPSLTEAYLRACVQRSLNRLHLPSLPLLQLHWWDFSISGYVEMGQIIQKFKAEGLVQHIGLTNFDVRRTEEVREGGVEVSSVQIQLSMVDQRALGGGGREGGGVLEHAGREGIAVLAYGVLAGGFLTDKWLGREKPGEGGGGGGREGGMENRSLMKYLLVIEEWGGWEKLQRLLRVCRTIADRHTAANSAAAAAATAVTANTALTATAATTTTNPSAPAAATTQLLTSPLPTEPSSSPPPPTPPSSPPSLPITIAMVAIRYVLDLPNVSAVILGSCTPSHIEQAVRAAEGKREGGREGGREGEREEGGEGGREGVARIVHHRYSVCWEVGEGGREGEALGSLSPSRAPCHIRHTTPEGWRAGGREGGRGGWMPPSFVLTEEDRVEINAVLREGGREGGLPGEVYELERQTTGPHAAIMKYNLNEGLMEGRHCDELLSRYLDGLAYHFPLAFPSSLPLPSSPSFPPRLPPSNASSRRAAATWARAFLRELGLLDENRLSPSQCITRRLLSSSLRLLLLQQEEEVVPRGVVTAEAPLQVLAVIERMGGGRREGERAMSQEEAQEEAQEEKEGDEGQMMRVSSCASIFQEGREGGMAALSSILLALPQVFLRDAIIDLRVSGPLPSLWARRVIRSTHALATFLREGGRKGERERSLSGYLEGRGGEGGRERRRDGGTDEAFLREAAALAVEVFAKTVQCDCVVGEEEDEEEEEGGMEEWREVGGEEDEEEMEEEDEEGARIMRAEERKERRRKQLLEGAKADSKAGGGGGKRREGRRGGGGETKGGQARMGLGVGREALRKFAVLMYGHQVPGEDWKEGGEEREMEREEEEERERRRGEELLVDIERKGEKTFGKVVMELEETAKIISAAEGRERGREDGKKWGRTWQDWWRELKGTELPSAGASAAIPATAVAATTGSGCDNTSTASTIAAVGSFLPPALPQPLPRPWFTCSGFTDGYNLLVAEEPFLLPPSTPSSAAIAAPTAATATSSTLPSLPPSLLPARLLFLRRLLVSAVRCLLDIKLNGGEWSHRKVCAFLKETIGMSEEEAGREVWLYLTQPLVACGGLMGWEEIRRWRMESGGEGGRKFWEGLGRHGRIPVCFVRYLEEGQEGGRKGGI
ncbi:hypothetical protein VYU27_005609 [Nannochloropsis oceanica]